ncbi:MAG TPA: biotin--[acetyl-CoA-carboxylase] ligase [Longimicrobiales bacterium]|nr:biotin--[acetyl-CoA-carboxylase] ligase [Longimicrobiales bacterium]
MTDRPRARWEGAPVERWRAAWGVPRLRVFHTLDSTNDLARDLAEAGAPAGTVVLADQQRRGRGQHGRSWHATPGKGLLLSVLVRPAPAAGEPTAPAVLPVRVGLAVARAVDATVGVNVGLKWPNDLLLDGGKLAGILCEGARGGAGDAFVVVGVGINVDQAPNELPPGLDPPATSLRIATGRPVARAPLAGEVVRAVLACARDAIRPLSAQELAEFAARDVLRGRAVRVDGVDAGTAVGLDPDGALRLDRNGTIEAIRAGSVRLATAAARDLYLTGTEP